MNRKARRAGSNRLSPDGSHAPLHATLSQAVAKLASGDTKAAALAAQLALAANPRSGEAHYLLGNAFLFETRCGEAAACYSRAIQFSPRLAEAHNNLGVALERQGRLEDAAGRYRAAIALRATYAEAHNNLGNVLLAMDMAADAVGCFRQAIAARGIYHEAHYNLANALSILDRGEEAVASYLQALALQPRFLEALNNLSVLLLELGRPMEAVAISHRAAAIDPTLPESQINLANAFRDCKRWDEAIAVYRHASKLRPGDAEIYIALGNILLARGQTDEAYRLFHHAHRLRPVSKRPGAKRKADFAILVLTAPGTANTPSDYLIGRRNYDSHFAALMLGAAHDPDQLRKSGAVVFNLISDVDMGRDILPQAVELVEKLGLPILNDPRIILTTGREDIAARIAGIPCCRVPKTVRVSGAVLGGPDASAALAGFAFPLLLRRSGTHGGEEFEQLASLDAVAAFVSRKPDADYYAIEYVPYESADGHFRKYRLIFTDGHIFPYHLAIADQWKVHHFRTDMANQEWMRKEEEAFVRDPLSVFGPAQWEALHHVRVAIGLDYFGIDCALDRNGDVVVFEVNATMLVHGEKGIFAYKQSYIARIKDAFDAMLRKASQNAVCP